MIEDGRDSDRPHAYEARGLNRNRPNFEREDTNHAAIRDHSLIGRIKDLGGVQITPPRPQGLHPAGALARPHQKKTMTL
jgi:hypothetical protein